MTQFNVPTRDEVSENNQVIFDNLQKQLGMVPNLFATFAHSDSALETYLNLSQAQAKGSLNAKEREAINLVVSQVNNCRYCQSAHTAIGKMNGFNEEEIIELRKGQSDDAKLDALVKLAKDITISRGNPNQETVQAFYDAGYDKGSLIDVVLLVSDKIFANYVHNITQVAIDFPVAPELTEDAAA